MVIDVEDCHLSERRQVLGGARRGVEITKSSERAPFGVMSGGTHQCVGELRSFEKTARPGERAIDSVFRRIPRVAVQGSKRVDAIVSRAYFEIVGHARRIS